MNTLFRIAVGFILVAGIAAVALTLFSAPQEAPYALSHIEVADDAVERERGLSGREVPEDFGMLFIFPEPGRYAFWMKDMLVPIDILWLSEDGTILGIEEQVSPESYPEAFIPPVPVRVVLEVRAGTSALRGWEVGDTLVLPIP